MKKSSSQILLLIMSIVMIVSGAIVLFCGLTVLVIGTSASSAASNLFSEALKTIPAAESLHAFGTTLIILYASGTCIAGISELVSGILGIKAQKSGKITAFLVFVIIGLVFLSAGFIFGLIFGAFDFYSFVSIIFAILALVFSIKVRDELSKKVEGIPQAAPSTTASAISSAMSDAADEMQRESQDAQKKQS